MIFIDDRVTCEQVSADATIVEPATADALEDWVRDLRTELAADPPDWAVPDLAGPQDAQIATWNMRTRPVGTGEAGRHRKPG